MRSQQQRQSPEAGIRDFLDTHAVTVEPGTGGEAHAMPTPPPSFGAAGMGLLDTYTHEVWPPEAAAPAPPAEERGREDSQWMFAAPSGSLASR